MRKERGALHFRGAPTRLSAMLHGPKAPVEAKTLRVTLPGPGSLPLAVRRVGSTESAVSVLSFRLPRSTRPGSYKGTAEVGDRPIPIVVDVEANLRLRVAPPRLALQVRPDSTITAELTLLNLGNVDFTVEPKYTFCVFDDSGIDRAIFSSLAKPGAQGARRLDRFLDELADSHGGLVQVILGTGAGRMAPGEVRELIVDLHFSDRLRPGRTYSGAWLIGNTSCDVEVEAVERGRGQ